MQRKRSFSTLLLLTGMLVLMAGLLGCNTRTLRNADLWYQLSVPKAWKIRGTTIVSGQGDSIDITRFRDDSNLERFVDSQRRAFKIEKADFVIDDEAWVKVVGRKAFRMVGTDKGKNTETVWLLVFVDVGQYKYRLWIKTPNDTYRSREKTLNAIVNTFVVKLPEY